MQLKTPEKQTNITSDTTKRPCNRLESQALTGNEDEEAANSYCNGQEHNQNSERAPVQCLLDKRLPNLVEVEEGVLAVSGNGDDGVEHVLMCEDEIDSDGEWKYDLRIALVDIPNQTAGDCIPSSVFLLTCPRR